MASSGAPDSKVSTGLDAVVSGELGQQGLVSRLREVLLSAEEQTFSIQSKERRLAEQATSLDNLRKESSGLREERDQLQHQLAELQSFAEKQQEHICKLQKSVQDAKKVRVGYEASLRGLEQRVRDLEEQIETRDVAQSKLQSELEHARLEGLAAAEKVRETEAILAQHKQTSERRTNELRKRCVSLQTAVGANEVELQSVRSEVASLRVGKQNALEEVSVLRDTEVAQKEALRHARGEASQSAERAAMLEKKITELEVQLKAQHVLVDEAHAEQTALEATLDKTRAKAAQDEELAAAKAQHLQNKLDALELERDEQVRTLEKGLHKARSELEKTNKARGEELAQEREAHAASVRGLTTRLNGLQRSLEQHQRLLQEARAERDETVEALSRAKAAQEELCGVVEKQNGEMAAIKAREEALTQALDEASKAAKAALAKANAKAQALEQDLQSAKRSAERADEELAAKSAESVDLSQELESLRKRAQDAADRLNASLQEERDMLTKVRKELGELQEERAREVQAFRERERKAASALQRAQQSAEASLQTEARKREVVETELRSRAANLTTATKEKDALASQLVEVKSLLRQAQEREKSTGARADVAESATRSLQQKLRAAEEELQAATKEAVTAQQTQAERYQGLVRKLADEYETCKGHLSKAKDRCGALEARNQQVQQTMAAQIVGLNEKARAYHQQSEGLRNEISRLKASLQVMVSKEAQATEATAATRQELEAKVQILETRVRQANQEKAAHELAISTLRQDFAAEKQSLQRMLEEDQQKAREEVQKSRWRSARVEEELNSLQVEKATLADQLARAQEENARLADNEQSLLKLYKSMADPAGPGAVTMGAHVKRGATSGKTRGAHALQTTASTGALRRPRPRSAAPRVSRRPAPAGKRKNHKPRLAPLALAVDATSASPLSFVDARDDNVENVGVEADVVDDAEEDGEDGEEEDDEDDEEGEEEEEEEDKIESDEIKSHTAIRSVADILRRKHQRNDGSPRRRMEEEGHRRAGEADPLTSRVEDDQNKRKVRTNQQKMKRMQERSTYPSGSGGGPGNNQTVDLSPTEVKQYLDEILRDDNVSC